jgi:hypothetical protein
VCAAKNVILAGVRAVTIHDRKAVELPHLSAQFYLSEKDVGKNRAEACKDNLQELNTAVNVCASSAELEPSFLQQFQVHACGENLRRTNQNIPSSSPLPPSQLPRQQPFSKPKHTQVMVMVGIRPVADALGRVNKLEVIPIEELGRPRVDVVVNCSGVFRDLFVNQVSTRLCAVHILHHAKQ